MLREHRRGLGHVQPAARHPRDAGGNAVPAPQLAQRDAETVGNRDQRVAARGRCKAGCGPEGSATGGTGTTRPRIPAMLSLGVSWLAVGQLRHRNPILLRHRRQRVSGNHAVVAPRVALALRESAPRAARKAWPCRPAGAGRRASSGGVTMRSRLGFSASISSTGAPTRSETSRRSME